MKGQDFTLWAVVTADQRNSRHSDDRVPIALDALGPTYMNLAAQHGIDPALMHRVAVIGENGVGKSTFLKLLMGELEPQFGSIKWTEKARLGYYAQDHAEDFKSDTSLTDWVSEFARANAAEGEDLETLIRGTLGRLLFSGDEVKKAVKVISGGEQGRMIFGKLMLMKTNVLVMDEPTNHLDMESIESLNTSLEKFKGTLVFVSHDREFVSSLATRILEIRMDGSVVNYLGNYEEYLSSQGID